MFSTAASLKASSPLCLSAHILHEEEEGDGGIYDYHLDLKKEKESRVFPLEKLPKTIHPKKRKLGAESDGVDSQERKG